MERGWLAGVAEEAAGESRLQAEAVETAEAVLAVQGVLEVATGRQLYHWWSHQTRRRRHRQEGEGVQCRG